MLTFYALAHDAESLGWAPDHPRIRVLDLRSLSLDERWRSNQFAETRFFLSDESAAIDSEYMGTGSTRFDAKFTGEPDLARLVDSTVVHRLLRRGVGLAPLLSRGDWVAQAEGLHPGMGRLLRETAARHGMSIRLTPVPYANTFFVDSRLVAELRDFLRVTLDDVIGRYGLDLPYTYPPTQPGVVNRDGFDRYRNDRHVGYFAERLTMMFFSDRRTPFVPSRVARLRTVRDVGHTALRLAALARLALPRRRVS